MALYSPVVCLVCVGSVFPKRVGPGTIEWWYYYYGHYYGHRSGADPTLVRSMDYGVRVSLSPLAPWKPLDVFLPFLLSFLSFFFSLHLFLSAFFLRFF